jgi:hypothetical protein
MDVRLITKSGVEERGVEELPLLLQHEDNLVWVDIPAWDDEAVRVLSEVFRFHPLAVNDAMERNRVPKMHAYHDHVFVILHAPERGKHGHVHYIELDQFVGLRYLVTVHGPINPAGQRGDDAGGVLRSQQLLVVGATLGIGHQRHRHRELLHSRSRNRVRALRIGRHSSKRRPALTTT